MKLKEAFEYAKIYFGGLLISTSCVLYVNDMFYNQVFKGINAFGDKVNLLQYLQMREVLGEGAKTTFIKNQIPEEKNDDSQIYHNYINLKKMDDYLNSNNLYDKFDNPKSKNIFENKKI